ncbi:MAG: porin [Myxococcales bacterium]
MTRRTRVLGLSTVCVLSYAASAAAQAKPAEAAAPEAAAATTTTTTTTTTTEPAPPLAPAEAAPPAPAPPVEPTAAPAAAPAAFAPLKIETPNASLKLGLLAQPQFEAIGNADPSHSGRSYNLFVRRIRLLAGGTLFGKFEYFFDTDSPNLFKGSAEGVKSAPLFVQDAYITFKAADDYFKIDAGYMLPPLAHNAVQGAGTLYGLDYFSNSFRHANAFLSTGDVGRDAGVQLRGLVADGHVEYRLGMFQGLRRPRSATEIESRNFPRVAGRIQINVLDPETGFFYAGTYLGTKKVLSFGASYDTQNDYHHWSVDGFLDLPLGPGTLTAQANFVKWNGGDFVTALPNQTAFMAEAGYRFQDAQISPILRFEYRNASTATVATPDEARYGLGLAYWPYGHNVNLKAFYTRIQPKAAPAPLDGYNQFQLQWQLYFY